MNEETEEDKPIKISDKADVWSLGCMISEILTGFLPWHTESKKNENVEVALISGKKFPFPKVLGDKYPEFKIFLEKCLNNDPLERCSALDIKEFILKRIS